MTLARRWRDMGLVTRIVGMSLALLLLVQVAGFMVVRGSIAENARGQIAHELEVGERVWRRVLQQNAERLRQGASVLAADFGFRAAVASADEATIRSALDNHGARIGARITALLDPGHALRTTSEGVGPGVEAELREVSRRLSDDDAAGHIALLDGTPYQFVMVPMRAPLLVGWVLMAFPIDQALAEDMYRLLSLHLVVTGRSGDDARVVVSTLPADAARAVLADGVDGVIGIDDDEYLARRTRLHHDRDGTVDTVLLRSIGEVTAPYRELQLTLAAITALAVVLFAFGNTLTARRVTQPLRQLIAFTERLQRGDYESRLRLGREADDEVGRLGRSFEHMRESIARQQREIRRLAYWDRLTGLPNREQFREALAAAIARRAPFAVLMLNLDRFKHVNDVLGYAFGDALLCAVAERLAERIEGEGDLVARIGGDEFAILLTGADDAAADAQAGDIARAFAAPLALSGQTVDLSAGIGIACWPDDGDTPDLLLNRAEIAMHAAKTRTLEVLRYAPEHDSTSAQTLSLLTELRRAIEQQQLRLYLQPKIDVAGGEVVAAEALVRWQHPERGLVPPGEFIPFAERTGFVRELTLWVIDCAASQWAALQPLRVSVNLSTRDLLDQRLPQRLAERLARHGAPPDGFCLEITESAIMDDPQRAEATLNRLAELGFRLSIDDFGTGYSSLAYLKRLPVHELKIDRSFVSAMEHDESDATIVRSTIDLAHNLGLTVVAEGVEDAAALDALRRLHCDEAQGYFISRPLPLSDFAGWRATHAG